MGSLISSVYQKWITLYNVYTKNVVHSVALEFLTYMVSLALFFTNKINFFWANGSYNKYTDPQIKEIGVKTRVYLQAYGSVTSKYLPSAKTSVLASPVYGYCRRQSP